MTAQLLVDGEVATALVFNRPHIAALTASGYDADGANFGGYAKKILDATAFAPSLVAAENFRVDGRLGFNVPIVCFSPVTDNQVMGLDVYPRGTPADFAADLGVAFIDLCNTEVGHTGTTFEVLRLAMGNTYATITTAANGGGQVVRPLLIQQNGGKVRIGDATLPTRMLEVAGDVAVGTLDTGDVSVHGDVAVVGATGVGSQSVHALDVRGDMIYQMYLRGLNVGATAFALIMIENADTPVRCYIGSGGATCANPDARSVGIFGTENAYDATIFTNNTKRVSVHATTGAVTILSGLLALAGLPASAAGLPAGTLWNSGGTVHVA